MEKHYLIQDVRRDKASRPRYAFYASGKIEYAKEWLNDNWSDDYRFQIGQFTVAEYYKAENDIDRDDPHDLNTFTGGPLDLDDLRYVKESDLDQVITFEHIEGVGGRIVAISNEEQRDQDYVDAMIDAVNENDESTTITVFTYEEAMIEMFVNRDKHDQISDFGEVLFEHLQEEGVISGDVRINENIK